MKIVLIILAVLFLFMVVKMFMPVKGVNQITTDELKGLLKKKNYNFIDVRSPGEYNGKHIKEFKNVPLQQLDQSALKLSKEKETVVICQSGMRSMQACKRLKKHGFSNLTNVKSGMNAWR